nr:ribonuclease H-like domain-containing protein [Tanacetum cinerariifolium]
MTDYSLWEVILNGDSPIPTRVIDGVVQPVAPTTAEQRLARKNELKAHSTLLMALPDKHQLKFNIHKDAKTLMEEMLPLVEIQKVMCDKKNNVLFTDTECILLSSNFKLPDDTHVLLRVPRENNMYNVDLKNIVPLGDLTCLFAKATLYESNLWHKRLGHINFKTMNKLVKGKDYAQNVKNLSKIEQYRTQDLKSTSKAESTGILLKKSSNEA